MTRSAFTRNLWYWKCNQKEIDLSPGNMNLEELRRTEWSKEFETLMRNRLVMGALRYGRLGAKDKPKYDRVNEIKKRLKKYENSGNLEYLVDIANMALIEFVESNHVNKHFSAIDDGEHTEINGIK